MPVFKFKNARPNKLRAALEDEVRRLRRKGDVHFDYCFYNLLVTYDCPVEVHRSQNIRAIWDDLTALCPGWERYLDGGEQE